MNLENARQRKEARHQRPLTVPTYTKCPEEANVERQKVGKRDTVEKRK
jgi:hypothetical protein